MRIEVGIDETMVSSVNSRPPDWRTMESQVCAENEEIFNCFVTLESSMRQQSVQSHRHTQRMPHVENEYKGEEEDWVFHQLKLSACWLLMMAFSTGTTTEPVEMAARKLK
jgi:hypothetical protein